MIVLGFSGIPSGELYRERYGLSFVGHDAAVALVDEVAACLARGELVGWVQGRMEYGPRALGHHSPLASPIERATRGLLELPGESAYMQLVVPIRPAGRDRLAAVDHDGTTRVQTVRAGGDPRFHALLEASGRLTGVPARLAVRAGSRRGRSRWNRGPTGSGCTRSAPRRSRGSSPARCGRRRAGR